MSWVIVVALVVGGGLVASAGEFRSQTGTYKGPSGVFTTRGGFRSPNGTFKPQTRYRPTTSFQGPSKVFVPQSRQYKPAQGYKPAGEYRVNPGTYHKGREFLDPRRDK